MPKMRGALGALLMAGAAYAWKNRSRLNQQFQSMRQQRRPTPDQTRGLPDYSATELRDFSLPADEPVLRERERGGFGGQSF